MKAATTSLYTYLKQHPDVFMSKVKEPMFFNNYKKENDYFVKGRKTKKITTLQDYTALFDKEKNQSAIGEASPAYIYDKKTPYLIKEVIPEVKIIVVLRQPIERAYSNFLHARRAGREPITKFTEAINSEEKRKENNWSPLYFYKDKGFYYKQLKRYFELFPKENIKVLLFEDVVKNPTTTTQEIFSFLGVDSNFIPDTKQKTNVSGTPKGVFGWLIMNLRYYNLIPNIAFSKYLPNFLVNFIFQSAYSKPEKLDAKLKRELTEKYFKQDILQLENLIKKDLSHWL